METFVGTESSKTYTVRVGYQKGAVEIQEDFTFTVRAISGSASEFLTTRTSSLFLFCFSIFLSSFLSRKWRF